MFFFMHNGRTAINVNNIVAVNFTETNTGAPIKATVWTSGNHWYETTDVTDIDRLRTILQTHSVEAQQG